MNLRIYIKQSINYDPINFTPTWYVGSNPMTLTPSQTLPSARRWQNWKGSNVPQYIDVTDFVSDLHKLKLTWTAERDNSGFPTPSALQPRKSASGLLNFERDAYFLLKQWLIDDPSAPINSVDVKIEHVGCGNYENYVIKPTDLRFCDSQALCQFDVTIKAKDEIYQCIQQTLISDNWQDWFPEDGKSFPGGKKHPRFSYCNEIRPNGQLVAAWFFMSLTSIIIIMTVPILISIFVLINGIIGVINAIIAVVNALGGNITPVNYIQIPGWQDIRQALGSFFLESAGCGREMPAVLIRDYISNVCSKCGVTVDATTAPVFFATHFNNTTSNKNRPGSTGGQINVFNPHYNACYYYAPIKRGIRRFKNITLSGFAQPNNTDYWIPENAPILALDQFLDQLKGLYNAEWMIKSIIIGGQTVPHLYFQRKDFYRNPSGQYIFDFSAMGADRHKILEGVCYEWNGRETYASCEGLYETDSVDTCGNEARTQMNDWVSFGNTSQNPTMKGILNKKTQFGATRFRLDGAATDYVMDAMQISTNIAGVLSAGFVGIIMFVVVQPELETYADYCLLVSDETAALPKVLIWDGNGVDNAKAVKSKAATTNNTPPYPVPEINPPYNNYGGAQPWNVKHPPEWFVRGSGLPIVNTPSGWYTVSDFFGIVKYQKPALLVNYPMYFAPGFYDGMWDWFHWLDDPTNNPALNMNWRLKIPLCCEDLNTLSVWNDGSDVQLTQLVKLDNAFFPDGKITEITVDYDPASDRGMAIEIKGIV